MADKARTKIEVEERQPDPLDCGCNAERERRVAAFLVDRLKDVEGIARIYSTREDGVIDISVEVEEFGSEAMEAAHKAFYRIRRSPLADGVDMLVRLHRSERHLGPEHTTWFSTHP